MVKNFIALKRYPLGPKNINRVFFPNASGILFKSLTVHEAEESSEYWKKLDFVITKQADSSDTVKNYMQPNEMEVDREKLVVANSHQFHYKKILEIRNESLTVTVGSYLVSQETFDSPQRRFEIVAINVDYEIGDFVVLLKNLNQSKSPVTSFPVSVLKEGIPNYFLSEDGKIIKQGERYFPVIVCNPGAYSLSVLESRCNAETDTLTASKNGILYFSCEEAATEFINMNKPLFSIKHIEDISEYQSETHVYISVKKFEALVNSLIQ